MPSNFESTHAEKNDLNDLIVNDTNRIESQNRQNVERLLEHAANPEFVISALEITGLTNPADAIVIDKPWAKATWDNFKALNPNAEVTWQRYVDALVLEDQDCGFFIPDSTVLNPKNEAIISIMPEDPDPKEAGVYNTSTRSISIASKNRYVMSPMVRTFCNNITKYPELIDRKLPNYINAGVLVHEMAHDSNGRAFYHLNETAQKLLRETLSDMAADEFGLADTDAYDQSYLDKSTRRVTEVKSNGFSYNFKTEELDVRTAESIEYKLKLLNALGLSVVDIPGELDKIFFPRAHELGLRRTKLENGEILSAVDELIGRQVKSRYGNDATAESIDRSVGENLILATANERATAALTAVYLGIEESFVPQHDFSDLVYIGYNTQDVTTGYDYALKMDDDTFVFIVCNPDPYNDSSVIHLDLCETSTPLKPRVRGDRGLYSYVNVDLDHERISKGKPSASSYFEEAKRKISESNSFPYAKDKIKFIQPLI